MSASHSRIRPTLEWFAAIAVASLLGVGGGTLLRADERADRVAPGVDGSLVRALGAPTGVLAVVNPVNCVLTAHDAAALNAIASIPGVRVTVLLLAVPARDTTIQRIRRDFGFAANVAVVSASTVDPTSLPEMFRAPFVAVVTRGELRHAAWGRSLKSLHDWLPTLVGLDPNAAPQPSPSQPS